MSFAKSFPQSPKFRNQLWRHWPGVLIG